MYFVSMKKRNRYEYLKMGPAGVKEKVGGGGKGEGFSDGLRRHFICRPLIDR